MNEDTKKMLAGLAGIVIALVTIMLTVKFFMLLFDWLFL